jgi:two-component system phosphate regulon sensor histidine kinase PhoR
MSMVLVAGLVTIASLIIMVRASINERRLSVLKSDFVANVSHELKTPLSLIRMFGELLLIDRTDNEEKRRQYLKIIVGESERLSALIENVLDFARVERGKATYDFAEGSVLDVARRAVEVYKVRAEREDVTLELVAEGPVPQTRIDARALELAIMNLIDNALKYAKDGRHVAVTVGTAGQSVFVRVADRGGGVPKEEQVRIFERFYRGSAAGATRARGSGIGLSLVQHIAQSHGGEVRVKSPAEEGGVGTAFEIVLPGAPPTRSARAEGTPELADPQPTGES